MENRNKNKMDWKWLLTTILALTIVSFMMWTIRGEVSRLSMSISSGDQRMARMETALHVIADTQDEKTRRSVDQALTVAQNSADSAAELVAAVKDCIANSDNVKAADAAQKARTLILTAKELKTPAPPGYFSTTTTMLDGLSTVESVDVARELFGTRVALAEYRSALELSPQVPEKVLELTLRPGEVLDSARLANGAVYRPTAQVLLPVSANLNASGAVIDGSELVSGQEVFGPQANQAQGGNSISGLTFWGVTQTLDGTAWKDVVFVNARIRYRGGALKLDHVRFVNCTFEVSQGDHGAQFAKNITLGSNAMNIG